VALEKSVDFGDFGREFLVGRSQRQVVGSRLRHSVRPKRLGLTSRVVYEQVVNNVDKSDMFLKYILLFVLTPSMSVSD
jgi:hypothetical protein